jgi:hypothetical protein
MLTAAYKVAEAMMRPFKPSVVLDRPGKNRKQRLSKTVRKVEHAAALVEKRAAKLATLAKAAVCTQQPKCVEGSQLQRRAQP